MNRRILFFCMSLMGLLLLAGGAAEAATTVSINLLNKTNSTLCVLNVSPIESNVWGTNILRGSQMAPWAERTFVGDAGHYDIRVQDCAGNTIALRYRVALTYDRVFDIVSDNNPAPGANNNNGGGNGGCVIPTSGPWPACASGGGGSAPAPAAPPTTGGGNGGCVIPTSGPWPPCASGGGGSAPAPATPPTTGGGNGGCVIPTSGPWPPCASGGNNNQAQAGRVALTIRNTSSTTICYLYMSPNNSSVWGSDWLGPAGTIPPGASRTFQVPAGIYDFAAEDCSRSIRFEEFGASLQGAFRWNLTD